MKILYVTNIPSPYRVNYFNKLGKQCELTVIFEKGNSVERDESWEKYSFENFRGIILNGVSYAVDKGFSLGILKYLKKEKYDLIILCNVMSLTGFVLVSYLRHKKIQYIVEGDGAFAPIQERKIKTIIKRYLLKGAKAYFSTCKNHDEYYRNYGVKDEQIFRYPFSSVYEKEIKEQILTKEEKISRRVELGIKEENVIIAVGQFVHRKGFDVLLKGIECLDENIGVYFIGGNNNEYSQYIKEQNVQRIHFEGFKDRNELFKYLDAADLFVLPTREDIWGLVVNEAMSRGLPVITTKRCNAGLEMIEEGKNGYIVPTEDSSFLTGRIQQFFNRKAHYKMARESLNKAKQYTIETMVIEHMKVFKRLM